MIAGKNINELAAEILRQNSIKRDWMVSTGRLALTPDLTVSLATKAEPIILSPSRIFHEQAAERTGIPMRYYERMMQEEPELLATNVNRWLHKKPRGAMVRGLGDSARALLSDSYRPLDNIDVAEHLLPTLAGKGLEIKSAEITEKRLYIQAVSPRLTGEVKKGDAVQAGVIISNSEVGFGSLRMEHLVYRLACTNGAIMGESIRKAHIGTKAAPVAEAQTFIRAETQRLMDAAFWAQMRDGMDAMLTKEALEKLIAQMQGATKIELPNVEEAVEIVQKRYSLFDSERGSVLEHLARDGDLTLYGLANAITRTAQDAKNYDRAVELEQIGGEAFLLPRETFGLKN